MVTECVTRGQVNVVAWMGTLETLAKCLVSAFLSILLNDFQISFYCEILSILEYLEKVSFEDTVYLFHLMYHIRSLHRHSIYWQREIILRNPVMQIVLVTRHYFWL